MVDVEEEVRNNSGYSLDALVTLRSGQKVGVEVDGPFIGRSRQPNGSTRIKRRQLASLDDCPLVSVPYWEANIRGKIGLAAYLELELRFALEGGPCRGLMLESYLLGIHCNAIRL